MLALLKTVRPEAGYYARAFSYCPMKVYMVAQDGFPDRRAQSYQTARMAEGFRDGGFDTTILCSRSTSVIEASDICGTYGLRRQPDMKHLRDGLGPKARRLRPATLRTSLGLLALRGARSDVFLGRNPGKDPLASLLWLKTRGLLQARVFVELHEAKHYSSAADLRISGYVVINDVLRTFLLSRGISPERILMAPQAVDLRRYRAAHALDRRSLRAEFEWGEEESIVCYTGQLYSGRNVETLVAAMVGLPEHLILVLVGGNVAEHVQRVRAFADSHHLSRRVRLLGQCSAETTLRAQMAADVLAIPYASQTQTIEWCSPLKLPEYLATGRPIAAFSSGPLRLELRDDEVVWAKEETPVALAEAIREALIRPPRQFEEIQRRLGGWTWSDRARRIAEFIRSH